MPDILILHANDNVALALRGFNTGEAITAGPEPLVVRDPIPAGHKICLTSLLPNDTIVKYGCPIGHAVCPIEPGMWVHTHNVKTNLDRPIQYQYSPQLQPMAAKLPRMFQGYRRTDGKAGIRNELWVIPTVGCVNAIAALIAQQAQKFAPDKVEAVRAFAHSLGCGQLDEDHRHTQMVLAGLVRHPNAGGVLVLGLGCERNSIEEFQKVLGVYDPERVKFLCCQQKNDEIADSLALMEQLAARAGQFQRRDIPVSELIVGLKCGGSDSFSGTTANPLLGRFSDRLISQGGSVLLTEVPEMFGAETLLMNRCRDQETFEKTVALINRFKSYFASHHRPVYENPSPGNLEGGITTLEEKSLGCIQKSGTSAVVDVLQYGEQIREKGLNLLQAPGNDMVSATALAAAGAQMVLFTTGRGTPLGSPVTTVKISTNSMLADKKSDWIDFNAGSLLEGEPMDILADRFFEYLLSVASGRALTRTEAMGIADLTIFKTGVTT